MFWRLQQALARRRAAASELRPSMRPPSRPVAVGRRSRARRRLPSRPGETASSSGRARPNCLRYQEAKFLAPTASFWNLQPDFRTFSSIFFASSTHLPRYTSMTEQACESASLRENQIMVLVTPINSVISYVERAGTV